MQELSSSLKMFLVPGLPATTVPRPEKQKCTGSKLDEQDRAPLFIRMHEYSSIRAVDEVHELWDGGSETEEEAEVTGDHDFGPAARDAVENRLSDALR
jgi:hypothetical protein